MERLGYARIEDGGKVRTREGDEDGGWLLINEADARLRVWTASFDEDLDAPARRGAAYRFSRVQIANRVLFASGERMGLVTNDAEIRMVIGDPARPPSEVVIPIDPEWKRSREVPDAFRLLYALAQPRGMAALPDILDNARPAVAGHERPPQAGARSGGTIRPGGAGPSCQRRTARRISGPRTACPRPLA
ncbi:MAG TPA: hypothetical protein VN736_12760 [Candidatus Limnocylindrales bacterium]|nr:hypothetical protein [Candidatus Limnocylindrales bacterium]